MRFVRLLAVVIIVYGLSYVQYGSRQFLAALEQRPAEGVWYSIATNFNIGIVTAVIGIGLLLMKEWARTLWLMSSIAPGNRTGRLRRSAMFIAFLTSNCLRSGGARCVSLASRYISLLTERQNSCHSWL